jgi:hypothetical protein
LHLALHAPQLFTSVPRATSHPFVALPSQFANPALHTKPQVPDVHVGVALGTAAHVRPHAPHALMLVSVFASHPFDVFPSQLSKPGLH